MNDSAVMIACSLASIGVCFGLITLFIFRRTVDSAALRQSRARMLARLFEFRLFYEEPMLVWRAQKAFTRELLRLLGLVARPALLLGLPTAWLLVQLEAVYGYAPLEVGRPAIVTVQMANELTAADAAARLAAPPELAIETPPVRSLTDRQISWRVRPLRPVCGSVRVEIRGAAIHKSICAGVRRMFLVPRRVHSLLQFLSRPLEARLPQQDLAWVEVNYQATRVTIAGVALPWIAWFGLVSVVSTALFARWLPVEQ